MRVALGPDGLGTTWWDRALELRTPHPAPSLGPRLLLETPATCWTPPPPPRASPDPGPIYWRPKTRRTSWFSCLWTDHLPSTSISVGHRGPRLPVPTLLSPKKCQGIPSCSQDPRPSLPSHPPFGGHFTRSPVAFHSLPSSPGPHPLCFLHPRDTPRAAHGVPIGSQPLIET